MPPERRLRPSYLLIVLFIALGGSSEPGEGG